MNVRRRTVLHAGAALAAPGVLHAVTRRAMAQEGRKVIRSVPIGDLRVLDPIWTTAYITRNHGYLVWDTLFALDAQGQPQPQMVSGYERSGAGTTWTFQLRDGLLWHDDTPVLAEDCVASLRRWGVRDGMGRALMAVTDSLEAVDGRTFRLKLKRPVGFVLDALGKIDSNVPFMMPGRLAQTDPNEQVKEVIGSGPFRFRADEWIPGVKVVYEKFARYVPRDDPPSQAAGGKVVKVDRVESVYTPDAATAMSGLLTGEFDLLESPAPDLIPHMRKARGVVVTPNDPLGYMLFTVINHLHPPFDKVEARRALMAAVKQSDFMTATVGEGIPWRECAAVYGCAGDDPPQFDTLGWEPYDLDKAQRMFRESGYDGRPVVVMDPADNATLHPGALLITDALQKIGANVDLQAMDWSALVQRRASRAQPDQGGWNIFITNGTLSGISNPLASPFVQNCEGAYFGWPCDRRVTTLTADWANELDPGKRREILKKLEAVHLENVTQIPLGQYRSVIAHRDSLHGLLPGPSLFYWNIDKG